MTVRRLVLVRHAKAEAHGGVDLERSLAPRGQRDARAVGRWLAEWGHGADRVVVSPARRAQQTWQLAAVELGVTPEPVLDERLYTNTVEDLLAVLRRTPPGVRVLVLVGHNPSMEMLAQLLDDGAGDPGARKELDQKLPTSGIVVFAFDAAWADVGQGTGRLEAFAAPRG